MNDNVDITKIVNETLPPSASDEISTIFNELKKIARYHMGKSNGNTLSPTVLVNEAYLKLFQTKSYTWKNRKHFYHSASKAMRHIVYDNARRNMALKRFSKEDQCDLDVEHSANELGDQAIVDIENSLLDLQKQDPELVNIVELKFFVGLSSQEVGELYGCSRRTIERRWTDAKEYIEKYLKD